MAPALVAFPCRRTCIYRSLGETRLRIGLASELSLYSATQFLYSKNPVNFWMRMLESDTGSTGELRLLSRARIMARDEESELATRRSEWCFDEISRQG